MLSVFTVIAYSYCGKKCNAWNSPFCFFIADMAKRDASVKNTCLSCDILFIYDDNDDNVNEYSVRFFHVISKDWWFTYWRKYPENMPRGSCVLQALSGCML